MNFIKNLFRKISTFVSNIFTRKKAAPVIAAASAVVVSDVVVAEEVQAVEVAAPVVAAVAAAEVVEPSQEEADDLGALMEAIGQLAANRNYQTDEAVEAYYAGDKAVLVRIERAMRNKSYKAPGKNKKAKQARKARFDDLAAA